MMGYYFVKRPLFGIQAGIVERFADGPAALQVAEGNIVPFDEKIHGDKPGADAVPESLRKRPGKCPACGK